MRFYLKHLLFFFICGFVLETTAVAATQTVSGAQAGPLGVSTGDIINVTGTGNLSGAGSNDGVSGDSANNVTITVANGGEIQSAGGRVGAGNAGKAIDVGSGANITVASGATVYDGGSNAPGDDEHAAGIYAGTNAIINVSGTVETDDTGGGGFNHFSEAIITSTGANITVNSGGLVLDNAFGGAAVSVDANSTVVNHGTIHSASMGQADIGAIHATNSNITITNDGTITASANEAVVFGTAGTSTGNVLNLYGNGVVTGNLRNDGTAGGAIVNFGYDGSSTDGSANVTMTGNIGSAGNAWNGHAYGGTTTVTGNASFKNLQIDPYAVLNINGNYTQGSGSTLVEGIANSIDYGKLVTNATASLASGSTVSVNVQGYVPNGSTFTVVNTGGNGIGSVPGISSTSSVVTFTGAATGGNLVLTASNAGLSSTTSSNNNNYNVAKVLDDTATSASSPLYGALNHLYSTTSSSQLNNSLNSLPSHLNNLIPQVGKDVLDEVTQQILMNTYSIGIDSAFAFNGNGSSGVSTGSDMSKQVSVWAQGFGGYLRQEAQQLSNGYDASVSGFVLGIEKELSDAWKLGFSEGLSNEIIHGSDSSNNTDADNYQSSLYATYHNEAYYVNSVLSFAYNHYDNSRNVNDGVDNMTAISQVDGQQYSTYVEGGYLINRGNWLITPLASFEYMKLYVPDYTESGAGALDLNVNSTDYNSAQTGLGFKLGYPVNLSSLKLLPEFKFKWLHDWVGDPLESTASFTGGGTAFNTVGFTPDRNTYELGTQLTIFTTKNIVISLNYDLDLRDHFQGNTGFVNVKYSF